MAVLDDRRGLFFNFCCGATSALGCVGWFGFGCRGGGFEQVIQRKALVGGHLLHALDQIAPRGVGTAADLAFNTTLQAAQFGERQSGKVHDFSY